MNVEMNNFFKQSEAMINRTLDNQYIGITIKVLLGLYAAVAAPKLSRTSAKLLDNIFVRISVAFLIVYMATKDITISLLIGTIFIISLQTSNKYKLYETSLSVAEANKTSWLPSAKSPINTNVVGDNLNDGEDINNLVDSVNDENINGLSKDEVQIMRNAEPSQNLEAFVENIEGAEVPTLVKTAFTTDLNLSDAQSGKVPSSNQRSCQKSFENQHCIQGLDTNMPDGFNDTRPINNF